MARPAPARPAREVPRSAGVIESRSSPFDFVGHMTAIVAILPVAHEAARAMLPAGSRSRGAGRDAGRSAPSGADSGSAERRALAAAAVRRRLSRVHSGGAVRRTSRRPRAGGWALLLPSAALSRSRPADSGGAAPVCLRQAARRDPDDRRQLQDRRIGRRGAACSRRNTGSLARRSSRRVWPRGRCSICR